MNVNLVQYPNGRFPFSMSLYQFFTRLFHQNMADSETIKRKDKEQELSSQSNTYPT